MRHIFAAIFAALTLIGTTAFAQEANDFRTTFPTAQELADQANGVTARYEGWEIRCEQLDRNCRLFQVAQDSEGNNVLSVTMQALPEGSAAQLGIVMVSPLLTLLPRGLSMSVDDGVPAAYPFSWCDPQGCYSRFGLTEAQVESFKQGKVANIDIFSVTNADQAVRAVLPLAGFGDAMADLVAR